MAPNYDVYIKVIITRTEVTLNVMTCLMFMMLMEQRCIKVIGSAKKKGNLLLWQLMKSIFVLCSVIELYTSTLIACISDFKING